MKPGSLSYEGTLYRTLLPQVRFAGQRAAQQHGSTAAVCSPQQVSRQPVEVAALEFKILYRTQPYRPDSSVQQQSVQLLQTRVWAQLVHDPGLDMSVTGTAAVVSYDTGRCFAEKQLPPFVHDTVPLLALY